MCCVADTVAFFVETSLLAQDAPTAPLYACGRGWFTWLDLSFNAIFVLFGVLRFLGTTNKLLFWWSLRSMVDCVTVPQAIIYAVIGADFRGSRFVRVLRLRKLPDLLTYLHVLNGCASTRHSLNSCFSETLFHCSLSILCFSSCLLLLRMLGCNSIHYSD